MTGTAAASTATDVLPPGLVARFAAALDRLRPNGGRIGLAVSGGPDSMAMLLLAHATIPGEFEVATVDHRLRPEAVDECALVERSCAGRGIPCSVLRVDVGEGNLQEQARIARYRALSRWAERRGLAFVATAHHADDQAETLLMRLNRGAGVGGLAGIHERGAYDEPGYGLPLVRPLLTFRRADLLGIVETAGVRFARDPSNEDEGFERVRIRKALADADWLDPVALSRSASHLADADAALAAFAMHLWSLRQQDGLEIMIRPTLVREIDLRLLDHALSETGGRPRGSDLARLLDKLASGEGGNVAGVLVTAAGDKWLLRPEPPRRTG